MKRIKKLLTVMLALTLIVGTVGCGNVQEANNNGNISKKNGKLKTVRIGSPTAEATALNENAGLALNLGYLEEELKKAGYKAEYVGFGQGGTAVNEALASNQIDLGFTGDIPPIIAQSNGLDIQIVASLNKESELGIVVGNNSGIEKVSDLKGKKIVAGFGTVTYVYLVNLLKKNNMSIEDVEVINDLANGATLVASGDADAVISSGIGIYIFENSGIGKILTSSREDQSLSAQYFAYGNKKFITENGEAVKAVIRALIRSQDTANENPDAAYKALESEGRTIEVLQQTYPKELGFDMFDPYLTKEAREKYEETAKILLDNQIITSDVKAKDIFETKYLDQVYKEQGKDIPTE